jgi:hypothetical protein
LILKQREILEEVKEKNNYYMTHEIVDKYERSIRHLETQIQQLHQDTPGAALPERSLVSYYDFLNSSKTAKQVDFGVQVNTIQPQQQTKQQPQQPVMLVNDPAISKMMGMMSHIIQQQHEQNLFNQEQRTPRKENVRFEDVSEVLSLPAPSPTRSRSRSMTEIANGSDAESIESEDSDSTVGTPKTRRHSFTSKRPSKEVVPDNVQEIYTALQQDIKNLEEQKQRLKQREEAVSERERTIQVASKPPQDPRSLYAASSINNYHYTSESSGEEVKRAVPKLGFFDRLVDKLIGQSPDNCIALICGKCFSHNGLMMIEDAKKTRSTLLLLFTN